MRKPRLALVTWADAWEETGDGFNADSPEVHRLHKFETVGWFVDKRTIDGVRVVILAVEKDLADNGVDWRGLIQIPLGMVTDLRFITP